MGLYICYFCVLHQELLKMHLTDIARDPGHTLTLEQKRAVDEARALVDRTQLQCLLAVSLLYHGIAHVYMCHAMAMQGSLRMWAS